MPSSLFTSPLSIRFEQLNSFTWPLCTLNLNSIDFFYDGKRASSATPKNIKKKHEEIKKKIKQGEKTEKRAKGTAHVSLKGGASASAGLLEQWGKPWMELRP